MSRISQAKNVASGRGRVPHGLLGRHLHGVIDSLCIWPIKMRKGTERGAAAGATKKQRLQHRVHGARTEVHRVLAFQINACGECFLRSGAQDASSL